MSISSNETIKLENKPNKGQEREMGANCKNKNATIIINLMIEDIRQKITRQSQSGSAAMARFVY